jgi:hypothetical protein
MLWLAFAISVIATVYVVNVVITTMKTSANTQAGVQPICGDCADPFVGFRDVRDFSKSEFTDIRKDFAVLRNQFELWLTDNITHLRASIEFGEIPNQRHLDVLLTVVHDFQQTLGNAVNELDSREYDHRCVFGEVIKDIVPNPAELRFLGGQTGRIYKNDPALLAGMVLNHMELAEAYLPIHKVD